MLVSELKAQSGRRAFFGKSFAKGVDRPRLLDTFTARSKESGLASPCSEETRSGSFRIIEPSASVPFAATHLKAVSVEEQISGQALMRSIRC